MDKEYWGRERQIRLHVEGELITRIAGGKAKGWLDNPARLFPEFNLCEPFGNFVLGDSVLLYLPFYETVIVPLYPLDDEEAYKLHYGISLDQLLELHRQSIVGLVLVGEPQSFPTSVRTFLSVYHLPHANRFLNALTEISGLDAFEFDEGPILRRKLASWSIHRQQRDHIVGLVQRLIACGYRTLVYELFNISEPELFIEQLEACYWLFASRFVDSLGGWVTLSAEQWNKAKSLHTSLSSEMRLIPTDLLFELQRALTYELPYSVEEPVDYAMRLKEEDSVKEHHKILVATAAAFDQRSSVALPTVREAVDEMCRKSHELARFAHRTERVMQICFGVFEVAALVLDLAGLPFSWLGSIPSAILQANSERINELIAGRRYGKNSAAFLVWQHRKRYGI